MSLFYVTRPTSGLGTNSVSSNDPLRRSLLRCLKDFETLEIFSSTSLLAHFRRRRRSQFPVHSVVEKVVGVCALVVEVSLTVEGRPP